MSYYKYANAGMSLANSTGFMKKRRKRFAKRYPRTNRYSNIAAKAVGIQRQVNFLKGIVNAEKHYNDSDGAINVVYTGQTNSLVNIIQGTDNGQRIGNSILAKYINIRGIITRATTSAPATDFVRVIIFLDYMSEASAPTVGEVLEANTVTSPINKENSSRYWIMFDKTYSITADRPGYSFRIFRKLNNHIKFVNNTGTSAYKNVPYIMMLRSVNDTAYPVLTYDCRLAYYDN